MEKMDIEVVENAPEQQTEPKVADTDFDLIDLSVLEVPDVGDTVTYKNHPNPDFNGEKVTVTASKLAMDNASYVVTVKFSNGSIMTMYDTYLYKG